MSSPSDDLVHKLSELGMTPESIASTVKAPVKEVQATLTTYHKSTALDVDKELQTEARAFVRVALARANVLLRFGLPSQQISLIRTVLPVAMRALGASSESTGEETKEKLDVLFREIREVPAAPRSTPEAVIDVSPEAVAETTPNQDQTFGDAPI